MSNFGRRELQLLINQYLGLEPSKPLPLSITRQIQRLVLNQNFDYEEIADCVTYYHEYLKKQMDIIHGLWFADNVRSQARQYKEESARIKNEKINEAKKFDLQNEVMVIDIKEITKNKPPRRLSQLDFDDIELEDGDENGNK